MALRGGSMDDEVVDNLNRPRPEGWYESQLFRFVEDGWGNTLATFANKNIVCRRLEEVDVLFSAVQDGLKLLRMSQLVPSLLLMRSIGAYRSTVALAMAHPTDAFAVMRSCLESAGYGVFIARDEKLAEMWLRRDEDKKTKQAVRDRFTQGAVREAVAKHEPQLGEVYKALYERAIDFGAHPNEKAVLTNLRPDSIRAAEKIDYKLLGGDGPLLDGVLRSTVQTGICVLRLFHYVFPERYDETNMVARVAEVSRGF